MANPRQYFKEVRFQQLRALVEVGRQRSFAKAAAAVHLSVPSVWQQVRALEAEFAVPLVVMRGRSVDLTDDGRLLMELAAPLVEGFDSLKALFLDRRNRLSRQLTLATTPSLLANELRAPLKDYRRRQSEVRLTCLDRPSPAARDLLERGQADVAVVGMLDEAPPPALLNATVLCSYPFMLVCPKDHPLATRARMTLADLAGVPLVMPSEDTNSRQRVDRVFGEAGLAGRLTVAMSASTIGLIAGYVDLDFGVSVVSVSPQVLEEARSGAKAYAGLIFRDLTRLFGVEHIAVLTRRGQLDLPHLVALRQVLEDSLGKPEGG